MLTGTSAGIGFAIPISTVQRVVSQLVEFGRVVRPALGVQVSNQGPNPTPAGYALVATPEPFHRLLA